jgi:hypothetical protein
MARHAAIAVALATLAAGCLGGSSRPERPGTISPRSLERAAERAGFPVRLPDPLGERNVLNVTWVTAGNGSVGELSFELVAPGGGIVTVDQAGGAEAGLIRTLVADTTLLGSRKIGTGRWNAYRAPRLAGLLLVHRDQTGVETAVSGDASLEALTAVAASLR